MNNQMELEDFINYVNSGKAVTAGSEIHHAFTGSPASDC